MENKDTNIAVFIVAQYSSFDLKIFEIYVFVTIVSLLLDGPGAVRFQPLLKSCVIVATPPHTIISYRNLTITVSVLSGFILKC